MEAPHPSPFIHNPTHPHTHKTTLIFLHGTSQTGPELASILLSFPIPPPVRSLSTSSNSDPLTQNQAETKTLAELLPNTRFVFPTGSPKKTTVFAGLETNSWFNIHTFVDRTVGETEQIPGLAESINYLSSLINDEVEELVKARVRREEAGDRIVVGGFSSGAALAVLGFLSGEFERRERIGAVVALSGWLPFRAQIDKVIENHKEVGDGERKWAVRKYVRQLLYMNDGVQGDKMEKMREEKAEILICHGKKDVKVRYEWGVEMTGVLKRMGQKIECRSYEGLEHWVCGEEMLHVGGFVEGVWEGLE
jgi:predicted esterase